MTRQHIETIQAPKAIGTYSQAMRSGNMVFLSGQIGLNPDTMELVDGIEKQVDQVFRNLAVIIAAAGGSPADVVKINIYLTDLAHFGLVNEIMPRYFSAPYPARAVVGVAALPRGAMIEADATLVLPAAIEVSPEKEAVLPR